MAGIEIANKNNPLRWSKVVGLLTLEDLQADGIPESQSAWTITNPVFQGQNDSSAQDQFINGVFLKPDGTRMFLIGTQNQDIDSYTLDTAWDVKTATFNSDSLSVTAQDSLPRGLFFREDGEKVYHTGSQNDKVYEYDLTTAWDLSTGTFKNDLNVNPQDNNPLCVTLSPDGTMMFLAGSQSGITPYTLSTAWDVTSASPGTAFDTSNEDNFVFGIQFSTDGQRMFTLGEVTQKVYQYDLSLPWDVSTASVVNSFDISSLTTEPRGLFFREDGQKMYISAGEGTALTFEYDL